MSKKLILEAEVKSNIGDVSKDASGLASEFKVMGVSLNDVKKGFVTMGTTAKASFATIKAGIASTGIGALVLAIGSLITYFTNTKRGADQLSQAFTAMGAVVDVLKDRLSQVGEALTFVFSGEFRKAGEALKGVFSGITEEVKKEVAAMVALKKRTQELRDADMEFMVQKAKTRQEIEKARLIAEDETKSAKERLDNLKTALELEEKTTQRELELARERMKIQEQEMALSENSAEDEQRLAQLKTDIIEKETASIKMRRRVVTEVNSLEREIRAEEEARAKARMDEIAKEKKAREDLYDAQIKQADAWLKKVEKLEQDEIAKEKAIENAKINLAKRSLNLVGGLAEEGTALAKGIAVARATMNGIQGVQAAYTTAQESPITIGFPGYPIVQAGLAAAFATLQIQKIMSVQPGGGTDMSVDGAGGGSGTPAPQMMSGAFELTGGMAPEPLKAFVVTDEMTNSQNQLANIRRRATI
tara:strand:- start:235 stop:1656 length:1422 start_codon:yes stop_codon:yes gene_type:complete